MAIFSFKLKTLHRLKTQLEDQAKNKFSAAVARFNVELFKLNKINSAIASAIEDFRKLSGGRFTAGKIRDFNYYLASMKEKAAIQEIAVEKALNAVNRTREELIVASREREMYDKLRDKAYAIHMNEEKRAEQRVVDEIVSYRGSSKSELQEVI